MKPATITSKGQITIPKGIRDALGLRENDKVIFVVEGDKAIMRPVRVVPLEELRGTFGGRVTYSGRVAERKAARQYVANEVKSVPKD